MFEDAKEWVKAAALEAMRGRVNDYNQMRDGFQGVVDERKAELPVNLNTILGGLGGSIHKNLVQAPIDAAQQIGQGAIDAYHGAPSMTPEQMTQAAIEIGMLPVGAGMVAKPSPSTLSIFGGQAAKNADLDALARAQDMVTGGAGRDEVWRETGWGMAPDGKWRFEIDDSGMDFTIPQGKPDRHTLERLEYFKNAPREELIKRRDELGLGYDVDYYRQNQVDDIERKIKDSYLNKLYSSADVLEHPDLLKQYPDIENLEASFHKDAGGWHARYSPTDDHVLLNMANTRHNIADSVIHELQHAIQKREDFSKGGTPDFMRNILINNSFEETRPYSKGAGEYRLASRKGERYGLAKYINDLESLARKEDIKPSRITNLSDWYAHSDSIRDMLGAMPKKAGMERDEWLRGAAAYIAKKNRNDAPHGVLVALDESAEDIIKNYRQSQRKMKKNSKDYSKYNEIARKYDALEKRSDFENYQDLLGEIEAREVSERLHLTPEQRRQQTPKFLSRDDAIIHGLMSK